MAMESPQMETQKKMIMFARIMKKTLITFSLFTLIFGLTNCKKQYSCQCSTTYERPGYYPYTTSSVEKIGKKTTKKNAEKICVIVEEQLASTAKHYAYSNETVTSSCALKN